MQAAACENGYSCEDGLIGDCPTGYYCPFGASIAPCADGSYSISGYVVTCSQCVAGFYCVSGVLITCPAGSYCPTGSFTYTTCEPGTYSGEGASSCSICPAGYYCSEGFQDDCPAGYFCVEGSSSATVCPGGKTSDANADSCKLCAGGFYCMAGAVYACPSGTISDPAASADDFVNPGFNFIFSICILILTSFIAVRYIFFSRLHRVAFLRRTRVVTALVQECLAVQTELSTIASTVVDGKKKITWSSCWKVTVFLCGSFCIVVFMTIQAFLIQIATIFYGSMILWRGVRFRLQDIPFLHRLTSTLDALGVHIGQFISLPSVHVSSALRKIFYPFPLDCRGGRGD